MGEISVPESQGPEDVGPEQVGPKGVGEVDAIAANENDEKQRLDEDKTNEEPDEDRDPTLQRDREDERLSPGQDTGGTGGAGAVMPPPD